MKATVALLDKNGESVVERVLNVLNSFDVGAPSHFGLILPNKSLFEKNVEIIKKQGLKSSTVAGYVTTKPKSNSDYEHLQLDDAALLLEGEYIHPYPKMPLQKNLPKNRFTAKPLCIHYSSKLMETIHFCCSRTAG